MFVVIKIYEIKYMPVLELSYSESNASFFPDIYGVQPAGAGINSSYGQTFLSPALFNITEAKFYLRKQNSPTGNIVAALYAVSGTVGSGAIPTGSVLAISDSIDITTLGSSAALVTFNFSTTYTLISGIGYAIVIYPTSGSFSSTITVQVGSDFSSPTAGGELVYFGNNVWASATSLATCFYIYGNPIKTFSQVIIIN